MTDEVADLNGVYLRPTARALVIDADRRLLLFLIEGLDIVDPNDPPDTIRSPTFWITPGGGVEEGETFEDAARREVFEETGIEAELGPCAYECDQLLVVNGRKILFRERYFVVSVERPEIAVEGNNELELALYREHRWWSVEELEQTDETVFPSGLAEIVREAFAKSD
jgi:8-oxo-dGTP diphosphatase